ncbi:5'-nucleotidase C-terminal domain-containing protein [Eisenbergiella sp.]
MKRKIFYAGMTMLLTAGILSGCASDGERKEIKGEADERTAISISWNYSIENFEKLVESTYPDIDLQWEIAPNRTAMSRHLRNGNATDLLMFEQNNTEETQQYCVDLSDTEMATRYSGTILKQIQTDGKIYLLPLPGQYSGYIINETLFEQGEVPLPETNGELLEALIELKKKGLGVGEDGLNCSLYGIYNYQMGCYIMGFHVPDFLGSVDGENWLSRYNDREGTMTEHMTAVFDFLAKAEEAGVLDTATMTGEKNTILQNERMGAGTLAVVYGDTALCNAFREENAARVASGTAEPYSYRMLPMFSDEGNAPWMLLMPRAYIGINAAADETVRDAGMRILDLLSTEEGQNAILKDLGMGYSYLSGYPVKEAEMPSELREYSESGYIYNMHFNNNVLAYLGEQTRQILKGKMTVEEGLAAVDAYNRDGSEAVDYDLSVVGHMEHEMLLENYNVRRGETEIGNFVADCVAQAVQAPIAVVNGGGIRADLYAGEVLGEDLKEVCPFDNHIIVLQMDGKTLTAMLENSVGGEIESKQPSGKFLQVSGIRYTFDSRLEPGKRILEVSLADGTAVEPDGLYQVAVNDYMAGSSTYAERNGDGYTMLNYYDSGSPKGNVTLVKETDLTYRDAMALYFEAYGEESYSGTLEGRIKNVAEK